MLSVGVKPRASSCALGILGMVYCVSFQSLYLLEIDTEMLVNEPSSLELVWNLFHGYTGVNRRR